VSVLDRDGQSSASESKKVINTVVATDSARLIVAGGSVTTNVTYHHHGTVASMPINYLVEQARADFVKTESYDTARKSLIDKNVVVLCGLRKTGRKTAALNLLREIRENAQQSGRPLVDVRRVLPTWLRPQTGALLRDAQHGYLLDLSDSLDKIDLSGNEDMRPDGQFGASLMEFSNTLTQKSSFLIVVTTPTVWEHCAISARSITVEWYAPLAVDVATIHLRGDLDCAGRVSWLGEEPFLSELRSATVAPGDAIRLAEAIARAQDTETGTAKDAALDEFRRWAKFLRGWFTKNSDVYDRVILIAAAVLGKARDQEIIDAADALLNEAGESDLVLKPLRAPDLVERLAKTEAEIGADHFVSLNATRPGLDEAVMDHVWEQRPKLHDNLLNWLVQLAIARGARLLDRDRIARVIAGLSLRREQGAPRLMDFAREQAGKGPAHHDLAVRIIEEAVLDPALGPAIRNKLLAWTTVKDEVRLNLAAAVCGGKLGIERTDLALTRLGKILANRDATPNVIHAAGRALSSLAAQDAIRPAVLDAVKELLATNPKAGARTFLELARLGDGSVIPNLLADSDARASLAECWQATYNVLGTRECASVMGSWIKAVESRELGEEDVLAVCLPTLCVETDLSLSSAMVKTASGALSERILHELVVHQQNQVQVP
jgi:hypothetical protein